MSAISFRNKFVKCVVGLGSLVKHLENCGSLGSYVPKPCLPMKCRVFKDLTHFDEVYF